MEILTEKDKTAPFDQPLILWNNDRYSALLCEKFSYERVIISLEQLLALDFKENYFPGAIVLAELEWNGHSFSDLYGIEIAKFFLRVQEKTRFPILFVSFFSLENILLDEESNKRLENQIVGSVGHDFLHLPAIPQNLLARLQTLNSLNELQFADIYNNLCNLKGLINGRIHERQGKLRSLEHKPDELKRQALLIFEKSLDEMFALLKEIPGTAQIIQKLKLEFREMLSDEKASFENIQNFLKQSDHNILALVAVDQNNDITKSNSADQFTKEPWKVLLLDDEPSSLLSLQHALESRGIECLLAQTVDQAEIIIKADNYNEIAVSVSDYRLLKKVGRVEKHQPRQGYDFLFWLAAQDRFTHLIALSGLSRKFLLESFQKYNTRVDVYSKQDLTGARAVHLLVDNIADRGQEVYEVVCSRPVVGDWKSLKPFYAAHRTSTEYRLKEQEINDRTKRFIRQYEELLETHDEKRFLQPELDNLSELTTKLAGKSPVDARSMEAFYNKLVGRRIALWLHLKLGFSRNEVFAALKGRLSPADILLEIENELKDELTDYDEKFSEKLKVKVHKKYKDNSTNLVTTNLALSFPVSGNELLIEEKYWLKTEIGIRNFDSPFSLSRQIPYFVQIAAEQFFEAAPRVAEKLREFNKNFTPSGKLVLVGFSDAKEVIQDIARAVLSDSEKKGFRQLLKVLDKNIRANARDSALGDKFLVLINENHEKSEDKD